MPRSDVFKALVLDENIFFFLFGLGIIQILFAAGGMAWLDQYKPGLLSNATGISDCLWQDPITGRVRGSIDDVASILMGVLSLSSVYYLIKRKLDADRMEMRRELFERRRLMIFSLMVLAVARVGLDAWFYVKLRGCIGFRIQWKPFTSFDIGLSDLLLGIVQLVFCTAVATTQWLFQCQVLQDMGQCKHRIERLESRWEEIDRAPNRGPNDYEYFRQAMNQCRSFVKFRADYWFRPLFLSIVIHTWGAASNAAYIFLQWFSYHERHATTTTSTPTNASTAGDVDNLVDERVLFHTGLAIIYLVQLFVFLPELCSINTRADDLQTFVVDRLRRNVQDDLFVLIAKSPVSFPVMGLRITKGWATGVLTAGMVSILASALSAANDAFKNLIK